MAQTSTHQRKTVNLALQGGGSHGAFTWGVLDRLLEDDGFDIEGISGTSAGAINAAVLAAGLMDGGRPGARKALDEFWRRLSDVASVATGPLSAFDWMKGGWNTDLSPGFVAFDLFSRLISPRDANPLDFNPLRDLLHETCRFEALRERSPVKLFICATNVLSGDLKVFTAEEVTVDALLASACLPFLFQAVKIGAEHYWDGGYMGNPAIFPLIDGCGCGDVVIVQINPFRRQEPPADARAILDRVNEISFNATLLRELRAIELVSSMAAEGVKTRRHLRQVRIHLVGNEPLMAGLGLASKLNADWAFLTHLRDEGRKTGARWLKKNRDSIGTRSSFELPR